MIIITDSTSNISKHKLEDGTSVFRNWDNIIINNVDFIYSQTKDNTIVYKDVTDTPSDWATEKYKYDGTTWTSNPNYNEPTREFLENVDGLNSFGNSMTPQPPEIVPA
jgi:hypothetical protein